MASATMGRKKGFGGKMAGFLKGKAGLVGIGTLAVGATLLNDDLSVGEKAAQVRREAGGTLADMAVGLFSDKDKPAPEIAQANGLNVLPAPALQPAGASVTQKVT